MDDDELLDALLSGLDAVDPPPQTLLTKALDASQWPNRPGFDELDQREDELVGAGMRASDVSTGDDGDDEMVRDLFFEAAGHTIEVTLDFEGSGSGGTHVVAIVTPRVELVNVVSPFGEPAEMLVDEAGRLDVRLELRAIALEFVATSGELVRTPLIRLS